MTPTAPAGLSRLEAHGPPDRGLEMVLAPSTVLSLFAVAPDKQPRDESILR